MGNGHMGNGICTHMQPGAFIDFAGRVHAPAAAGARRMTRADDTAPATRRTLWRAAGGGPAAAAREHVGKPPGVPVSWSSDRVAG